MKNKSESVNSLRVLGDNFNDMVNIRIESINIE